MGPGKITTVAVAHVLGSSCTRHCGVHTLVWMTRKHTAVQGLLSYVVRRRLDAYWRCSRLWSLVWKSTEI